MYIDNRILLPIVMPFAVVASLRAFWFFAGLTWSPEPVAISMAFVFSTMIGGMISAGLFIEEKKIGGFWIGKKP